MDREFIRELNRIRELAGIPLREGAADEMETYAELPPDVAQKLTAESFDVTPGMELYHGTNEEFDKFDRSFSRSASHIYTSPDPITSSGYGRNVYLVAGKTQPQADLTEDYELLGKIAKEIHETFLDNSKYEDEVKALREKTANQIATELALKDNQNPKGEGILDWYLDDVLWSDDLNSDYEKHPAYQQYEKLLKDTAINKAAEFLQSGKVYDYDFKGHFQDEIMDMLYEWGYKSVVFYDMATSAGGESVSVVFNDPDNLIVLGKAMEGMH
jgi:hypothetical protein